MNTHTYSLANTTLRGLAAWAIKAGNLDEKDAGHFARKIQSMIRTDLHENGLKEIAYTTKTGLDRTASVKDKTGSWKASGKGVNEKITLGGERNGLLTAKCSFLTRAIVKQNQALVGLNGEGYSLPFSVGAGSETEYALTKVLETFEPTATGVSEEESVPNEESVPQA